MKKLFKKLIQMIAKKIIKKYVAAEVGEGVQGVVPDSDSKKALWRFIIQTIINILAAVLTALGTTSCMNAL